MQNNQEIQNSLEIAGKGLPKVEAIFLRYLCFPILKMVFNPNRALKMFEYEGEKILKLVKPMDKNQLFQRVLIPKIFAIEDNSRYYSPAMVLWHLIYVGEAIQQGVVDLSQGKMINFTVKIENFKPFVEIDENIVERYEHFLANYRRFIETHSADMKSVYCHTHSWFGCLNPHGWLVMSMAHQLIHRRQIEVIIKMGINLKICHHLKSMSI